MCVWHSGTCFIGGNFMVGTHDLEGLFQPKQFNGSVVLCVPGGLELRKERGEKSFS